MRPPVLRTLVPLLLVLAPVGACAWNSEPEPRWRGVEVSAPSDRVLWKVTLLSMEKMGFPLAAGLDPGAMVATSGWRTTLAPFRGQGYRTQAEVRMEPVAPGRWHVDARVKRQTNESLAKPLDPRQAEWEWASDDELAATILLQHVRSFLETEIPLTERPADPIEAYLESIGEGPPRPVEEPPR
jgi:hypothetical protein